MTPINKPQSSKDVWNNLSQYFNTYKKDDEIEAGAADNILIAWPVIIDFIKNHFANPQESRALDYGCGTGSFCLELSSLGFDTTGIDYSEEMIKTAKTNISSNIKFIVGETKDVHNIAKEEGMFDLIVSIMALQFIENIDKAFKDLSKSLSKGGYLCFAVFNQDWARECIEKKILFHHLSNTKTADELVMDFGNERKVKVFNRGSKEYDSILRTLGFKKILEAYPPFTSQYIEKYKPAMPTDVPEFMILGYKNEQYIT